MHLHLYMGGDGNQTHYNAGHCSGVSWLYFCSFCICSSTWSQEVPAAVLVPCGISLIIGADLHMRMAHQ